MPRPRLKRLLRISLRMVFVLTTISCIWLGFKVHRAKQQREAVAWIKQHGGIVHYEHELTRNGPYIWVADSEPPGPKWLRDLIGDDYFAIATHVTLADDDSLDDLTPLAGLPGVKDLIIRSKAVTELEPLAKLKNLKYVVLDCDSVQDVSPLEKLRNAKDIFLPTSVSEEEVAKLEKMLPNCRIRDTSPLR